MSLYEWDDDYSVGVASMDSHHKNLFKILDKLHAAMKDGEAEEIIAGIINELIDYTKYHFSEEEKLMEKANFQGLPAHKREHDAFIQKMAKYKEKVDNGMAIFAVADVANAAVDWLREHIMVMDKKYKSVM